MIASALLLPLVRSGAAEATEYGSAREVFDAIDGLEADVAARLLAIATPFGGAGAFVASVRADHERHRAGRAALRRRLGLPAASAPAVGTGERGLEALRTAQEALVHAHAEGLPALDDARAVDVLVRHMVELSRHLTVIELWAEGEAARE